MARLDEMLSPQEALELLQELESSPEVVTLVRSKSNRCYHVGRLNYGLLGQLVAQRRLAENLTSSELARSIDIPKSTICRVQQGRRINSEHLLIITKWLSVPVEEFEMRRGHNRFHDDMRPRSLEDFGS